VANPQKILAIKVRRTGVTSGERFGLAHFSNGLWFFDEFSKLEVYMNERRHHLNESSSARFGGSQQLEILLRPNIKQAHNLST
jgi:hypothetical protein